MSFVIMTILKKCCYMNLVKNCVHFLNGTLNETSACVHMCGVCACVLYCVIQKCKVSNWLIVFEWKNELHDGKLCSTS